ncbi:hypothetical protein [Chryseobacterium mucoviscidosis]|uniref:hypothetical protein n=1 Tax=Chryseobacterium mucoviscidosis TaxID=1945581 RepID=UPI003019CE5C
MTITKLYIIDWFDNIITSIISFEKDVYLFQCIHKNFKTHEKTYYCVKIDEESFRKMELLVISTSTFGRKEWDIINEIFRRNNKKENVYLVKSISLSTAENIVFHELEVSDSLKIIKFPFDVSVLYNI